METNFGIRTAIIQTYNAVGGNAQELDLNSQTPVDASLPTAFVANGELNVSTASIANTVSNRYKVNPSLVDGVLAAMESEGILNIKLMKNNFGGIMPFVTINENESTDDELDSFRSAFNDKDQIK